VVGYGWFAVSALATALHPPRWNPGTLSRILAIKTDHIGDFLLCLPAVRDFVRREPDATVGFVVASENRVLAERVPWIDEVHVYDAKRYARRGASSEESVLRGVLVRGWELVLDLTNDSTSALAALRRPSRHRRDIGTYRLREYLRGLGRRQGPLGEHVASVFYRALGMPTPEPIVPEGIRTTEADRAEAAALLARAWPGDRPLVALHAGALWEFRRWPAARFAKIAQDLEERGFSVVIVGGPNDRDVSAAVAQSAGLSAARDLAGRTSLPVLAAIFERAAAVVANDGGPMHLAAAQGAPVVGVFGPTAPTWFAPIGATSRALWDRRDCSPCSQRHCVWGRARCLETIETDRVLRAVLEVAR
jgi:lipopolysaccharide heptosyltransferase II